MVGFTLGEVQDHLSFHLLALEVAVPLDPNLAAAATALLSSCSRPEKRPIFPNVSIFFQIRTHRKVLTAHRSLIYYIKAGEMFYPMQKELGCYDIYGSVKNFECVHIS